MAQATGLYRPATRRTKLAGVINFNGFAALAARVLHSVRRVADRNGRVARSTPNQGATRREKSRGLNLRACVRPSSAIMLDHAWRPMWRNWQTR